MTTTREALAVAERLEISTAPRDGRWIIGIYADPEIGEDVIAWRDERYCMLGCPQGSRGPGWVGRECGELPVDEPDHWRTLTGGAPNEPR
jgi:hypothetical protein